MFALSERPRNPELKAGELLLLQLVKTDARRLGKLRERINFALVFDRLERDYNGRISRRHWPNEGRTWDWIVYGSATVPTIPFSLENLEATKNYQGQDNARYIDHRDQELVQPLILWSLAQVPDPYSQIVPSSKIAQEFGKDRALTAVFNHDRIALLNPASTRRFIADQPDRNPWLADSLKSYYEHRCQVCGNDFQPTYGVQYSETHHIQYLSQGGPDISGNMVVLCPNHHRIIHTTHAEFDRESLSYEYPNGLQESLILPTHLSRAPRTDSQRELI
jgi:hypothetical protein